MKKLLLLALLAVAGVVAWGILRKHEPPRVNFSRAKRQTLVSTLPTNGKVEPFEWRSIHTETDGLIDKLALREGETVVQGAQIAVMSNPTVQSEIESAEARVSEAQAALAIVQAGARPPDVAGIETSLARTQLELQQASADLASLRRLVEKQAVTAAEVRAAHDKVKGLELEVQNLEKRRAALAPTSPDVAAARARLREAEIAAAAASKRATRSVIYAPMTGVIYGLNARSGSFVNAGALLANIGRLDRLRVRVYVDEPELGRVSLGQPVTIRWQALPGKEWQGTVERKPVSIQPLGSRQVGEVVCTIENPGRELIPGTNVDAEIRTAVVESTLVIPREALRHDAEGDFVLALKGGAVERRAVKTGASSVSQLEIVSGLAEGDAVAMPSEVSLKPGDPVTAVQ